MIKGMRMDPSEQAAGISDLESGLNRVRSRGQLFLPDGTVNEPVLVARVSNLRHGVRAARAARLRAGHPSLQSRACTMLFLYGTLRQGADSGSTLAGCAREDAFVDGARLVDAGSSPYLILNSTGTVRGELVTVTSEDLARVDMIEGYAPGQEESSLFIRVPVLVRTVGGGTVTAQTYVRGAHLDAPDGLTEVPGGDWVAWKRHRTAHGRSTG